jgi:prolyl-tRNA synthetase
MPEPAQKKQPGPKDQKAGLTPRAQDYAQWYLDAIARADLADYAPVKGCMVIKPYGFAIWESIRDALDRMIKDTGHVNAYFPLFIPLSFLAKEAHHVEGFAMECAIVTHSGLEKGPDGKLQVTGALEEPLVVRPTSETIIGHSMKQWIQSWRDLPLLLNQWANVVRWEMRTRLFLRTLEFLWQEGHTAHATADEAERETRLMLDVYETLLRDFFAIHVVKGRKTETEKFPGADVTYAIEGMMQDGKALQSGTSHNLGQNFAKAFDVQFQSKDGKLEFVQTTSWGVSTRLMGALIMAHGDDKGIVVPPRLAPHQVVFVPIWKSDDERAKVRPVLDEAVQGLRGAGIRVKVDDRENLSPGAKFYEWEGKGAPVRVEIGPKDVDKGHLVVARRDTGEKQFVPRAAFQAAVPALLDAIQAGLLERHKAFTAAHTADVADYAGLKAQVETGWARAAWCGGGDCEAKVKEEAKATIRVIPFEGGEPRAGDRCAVCGGEAKHRVIWSRAY